jgi:hypothetical protein
MLSWCIHSRPSQCEASDVQPRDAQLLPRGHVTLSVVLFEIRAEETRLCGAGMLGVSSVLAA